MHHPRIVYVEEERTEPVPSYTDVVLLFQCPEEFGVTDTAQEWLGVLTVSDGFGG